MNQRRLPGVDLRVSELGFGAAGIGNLFAPISDGDARASLDAAFAGGISYVDTAPFYGFGLSERRVGDALRGRRDVIISTKVGRLLKPDIDVVESSERYGFVSPMPFSPHFDYTYDGVMRSWEQSLQRLGLARIDVLYVHDIGERTHGAENAGMMRQLTSGGGLRALEELRDAGEIAALGLGVNETAACFDVMAETQLDIILLAGRYTLLEQEAAEALLPACGDAGIAVVIGGPYNSGILATGTKSGYARYNYAAAPTAILSRVAAIEAVAERHGIPLAAAALQFPLAHPAVISVVPGLAGPSQVAATIELFATGIPDEFWADLQELKLLQGGVPLPRSGFWRTGFHGRSESL